jgi:hypothetical protein
MAYSGATAASSLANPPRLVIAAGIAQFPASTGLTTNPTAGPNAQGGNLWYYSSTNLTTDIVASNFFTDGYYLGMKPGDMVTGVQFSSIGSSVTTFNGAIVGVSTSGAYMSTGSVMTSTFN